MWPPARAAEALELLAREAGFEPCDVPLPHTPSSALDDHAFDCFVDAIASGFGVELEPISVGFGDVEEILRRAAPCLVVVGEQLLALSAAERKRLRLVTPDGPYQLPIEDVRRAICADAERSVGREVDAVLDSVGVSPARRQRARGCMLGDRLRDQSVARAFLLRDRPGAPTARVARHARLPARLFALVAVHVLQYVLGLVAWAMIGRAALDGHFDRGWLEAWLLLLLTLVPFRLLTTSLSGAIAVDAGALLKQRLFAGALAIDPDAMRSRGVGQLLATVIESSAVEQTAIGGAFAGLIALIELVGAAVILFLGAGHGAHALLLVVWGVIAGTLAWRYGRSRGAWTDARLKLTHELVERMVGHRTRLAQEPPHRWHEEEDIGVARSFGVARAMDRTHALLLAVVPRGWLLLGILGLAPAFLRTPAPGAASLAIALGGVLLAERAFRRFATSLSLLTGAAIAWREARSLFLAAAHTEPPGAPSLTAVRVPRVAARPILEAHELTFRYRDRGEPVLRGATLTVHSGERVLVSGQSGGGKSTLAALFAGLRAPASGLLLLGGLDRPTLGAAGWRRRIATAPQFHDNHVIGETFAFNLLLGRRWPPEPEDLAEATAVCHELGLGALLARMPSGLSQALGETGWQLSHGERSRLFIARALLQDADLIVLDESFAALDPETLERALRCVIARARSLIVIAHP